MGTGNYSKVVIDHSDDRKTLWTIHNDLLDAAISPNNNHNQTMADIIKNLRDVSEKLILAGEIEHYTEKQDTAEYVRNQLDQKEITYSTGASFYRYFTDDQKRSFKKSTYTTHTHTFQLLLNTEETRIEECNCGVLTINGEEQTPKSPKKQTYNHTPSIPKELIPLSILSTTYSNLSKLINVIIKRGSEDTDIGRTRKEITLSIINNKDFTNLSKLNEEILYLNHLQNDKQKLTEYEIAGAKLLISNFLYDISDIATILHITTKHVRNTILQSKSTFFSKTNDLKELQFLKRCYNCGVNQSDHIEQKKLQLKQGRTITESFDLSNLQLPTYAKQNATLLEENRMLKKRLASK